MPRKSKSQKFKGTPFHKAKKDESVTITPQCPPADSPSTSQVVGHIKLPEKSKRFSDLDCNERSQGYRTISISCLNDALSSAHQCHGARLTVVDSRESNGLCSTLGLMCLACGVVTKWNTSEVADLNKSQPGKPPFDINRRAAYAISEVGLGRESLATFCGIMGMPLPSETKTWQSQVKAVNDAASDGFANSRHEAAINLRRKLAEDDGQIEDFSQVIDVAVSYDGTWHYRGFKSSHDVGVIMAIETGEILLPKNSMVKITSQGCFS